MSEETVKKISPHSKKAEDAVIGSVLIDQHKIEEIADILKPDDFYSKNHALIFDAMVDLYNEGKPIDAVTLQSKCKEKGAPEGMDISVTAKDIFSTVYTSANAVEYANIVHKKAIRRNLIKMSENISAECYDETKDIENIMTDSEKGIFDVIRSNNSGEIRPLDKIVVNALDKIEAASQIDGSLTGIPTGFTGLDIKTAGLQPSDLIVIAARPSMGKTALALTIADNIAILQEKPVAVFSLEMSSEQIATRLFSMEARIDAMDLKTGNLSDQEWFDLAEYSEKIANSKLIIDDTPSITIAELRSKCRKLKIEKDIQLLIIDYIQLMSSGTKAENRQQEISDISRALKALARELNIPIIALSQLNRAVDSRPDKRPVLSDIRESGAIEQDADIIIFLYRDEYYNPETNDKNIIEVTVAKHRNGPTGTVSLAWQPKYTRVANLARPSDVYR